MKFPVLRSVAALAVTPLPCPAARQSFRVPLSDDGSMVEITSVFDTVPPTGFAPMRMKLVNNSAGAQTVAIRNTSRMENIYGGGSHELESTFTLTAQPNKTAEQEFMVPLCTGVNLSSFSGGALTVMMQAGSLAKSFSVPAGGYNTTPFTAFSEALAGKTITDINRMAVSTSSSSRGFFGSPVFATLFDASLLPSEWRGLSGLDGLAITAEEWTGLQPAARTSILQWVKLGGVLDIYSKSGAPRLEELGVKVAAELGRRHDGGAYALGHGVVCDIHWSGSELSGEIARNYVSTSPSARQAEYSTALSDGQRSTTAGGVKSFGENPLVAALGEKSFAAWQVGLILFVFGIVVGPVNLFYLARSGRRHRLFVTTPVISMAAAALLLVVIFFQDGTGGRGQRASLVYLDAAENSAFIHQLQVSRTGVLFGGSFTTEEPSVVNMAVMPDTRWTRLKVKDSDSFIERRSRSEAQHYSASEKSYGGDWFQSRTEQAQIIDAVQSTRGRIELKSGGPGVPVITSTLTAPLERLFYLDGEGKHWTSPGPVTTGASVTLTPSNELDFRAWRKDASSMLPRALSERVNGPASRNFFYAVSSDPAAGTVATLESIRWESDKVFLYGPLRSETK